MGLYATVAAAVNCPQCGSVVDAGWQFHFGDVSQLPTYKVGDPIQWGGSDRGDPSMTEVVAIGYFDGARHFCSACSIEHALVEIQIVDHVIRGVAYRSSEPWIAPTLLVGPDRVPYAAGG
jgi:hypothetical protein